MLRRTFVPISPDRMYVCSMVRASVLVCWQKDMLERLTDLNVSDAIFTNLHKKKKNDRVTLRKECNEIDYV